MEGIIIGDTREVLPTIPDESVQMCATSPPYFGLRDYGMDAQMGREETPDEYVASLVGVMREVRRILRNDGTLWLNIGDSYAAGGNAGGGKFAKERRAWDGGMRAPKGFRAAPPGFKPKDLLLIPARVAIALQADGWYLRSDIIWNKPNVMPSSVRDRPTCSHEYVFLLAKSRRYYYDAAAVVEPAVSTRGSGNGYKRDAQLSYQNADGSAGGSDTPWKPQATRNRRDVWTVPVSRYKGAHFATFPTGLVEPCILAGSRAGDVVLDPFSGAGTTGVVAKQRSRRFLGIELNADYAALASERIAGVSAMVAA